jgi:hypothetical protein
MRFTQPAAWWALLLGLVFVLLSSYRRRPDAVEVSSVLLWKRIPPRTPPLRRVRAPRLSALFWIQLATLAVLVGSCAGPVWFRRGTAAPVVYAVDARPSWETRLRDGRTRLEAIRAQTGRMDVALPPRDPDPWLAIWRAQAEARSVPGAKIVWVSDRPPPAGWRPDGQIIVADDAPNMGWISARVVAERIVGVLLNHGPECVVRVNGLETRIPNGRTVIARPVHGDRAVLEIEVEDAWDGDDRIEFVRVADPPRVYVEGDVAPELARAIAAAHGVLVAEGREDVRIVTKRGTAEAFRPVSFALPESPVGQGVEAGEIAAAVAWAVEGEPLLFADGRPVVAFEGREIRLGVELRGSPWAATPSFPIFWKNAVDYARRDVMTAWQRVSGSPLEEALTDGRGRPAIQLPPAGEVLVERDGVPWACAAALAGMAVLAFFGGREG